MDLPLNGPIGVFDSGYGGLTILKEMRQLMPLYDYVYLGDNARAPYGSRSFDVVYEFTCQSVAKLFSLGCPLVVLACNTASAKALRTIQQNDLPQWDSSRRVLGVIRPTAEAVGKLTQSRHVGLVGTVGTISSGSYPLEIHKLFPDIQVTGQACPMFVPLVENDEFDDPGADYFVKKYLDKLFTADPLIDCLILGCTHYPLLINKIEKYLPAGVKVLPQGQVCATSLQNYFQRHTAMAQRITMGGSCKFLSTERPEKFRQSASKFLHTQVAATHISLD